MLYITILAVTGLITTSLLNRPFLLKDHNIHRNVIKPAFAETSCYKKLQSSVLEENVQETVTSRGFLKGKGRERFGDTSSIV